MQAVSTPAAESCWPSGYQHSASPGAAAQVSTQNQPSQIHRPLASTHGSTPDVFRDVGCSSYSGMQHSIASGPAPLQALTPATAMGQPDLCTPALMVPPRSAEGFPSRDPRIAAMRAREAVSQSPQQPLTSPLPASLQPASQSSQNPQSLAQPAAQQMPMAAAAASSPYAGATEGWAMPSVRQAGIKARAPLIPWPLGGHAAVQSPERSDQQDPAVGQAVAAFSALTTGVFNDRHEHCLMGSALQPAEQGMTELPPHLMPRRHDTQATLEDEAAAPASQEWRVEAFLNDAPISEYPDGREAEKSTMEVGSGADQDAARQQAGKGPEEATRLINELAVHLDPLQRHDLARLRRDRPAAANAAKSTMRLGAEPCPASTAPDSSQQGVEEQPLACHGREPALRAGCSLEHIEQRPVEAAGTALDHHDDGPCSPATSSFISIGGTSDIASRATQMDWEISSALQEVQEVGDRECAGHQSTAPPDEATSAAWTVDAQEAPNGGNVQQDVGSKSGQEGVVCETLETAVLPETLHYNSTGLLDHQEQMQQQEERSSSHAEAAPVHAAEVHQQQHDQSRSQAATALPPHEQQQLGERGHAEANASQLPQEQDLDGGQSGQAEAQTAGNHPAEEEQEQQQGRHSSHAEATAACSNQERQTGEACLKGAAPSSSTEVMAQEPPPRGMAGSMRACKRSPSAGPARAAQENGNSCGSGRCSPPALAGRGELDAGAQPALSAQQEPGQLSQKDLFAITSEKGHDGPGDTSDGGEDGGDGLEVDVCQGEIAAGNARQQEGGHTQGDDHMQQQESASGQDRKGYGGTMEPGKASNALPSGDVEEAPAQQPKTQKRKRAEAAKEAKAMYAFRHMPMTDMLCHEQRLGQPGGPSMYAMYAVASSSF